MGERLASSMERRLQAFRRELVVDLVTRHGEFWEQVRWIRKLQHIEAEARMPPILEPNTVHFPPSLKRARGDWSAEREQGFHEWMVLLNALHDAVIPVELHIETPYSYSLDFWMGFLSACVIFDPPPDDLVGFAEHGVAAYGDFVNPFNPWREGDKPSLEMLAPPIRHLPDPERLIAEEQERYNWVLGRLQQALDEREVIRRGEIDVREIAAHFEFVYESEEERARKKHDQPPSIPTRPYIAVDTHTTEDDVRNAFRLMTAEMSSRPRAVRPRRDPLVALQCALWYDDCGWSHERIGKQMDWTIQYPAAAKPRCETARQYIAEGRALRTQRNVAA